MRRSVLASGEGIASAVGFETWGICVSLEDGGPGASVADWQAQAAVAWINKTAMRMYGGDPGFGTAITSSTAAFRLPPVEDLA